MPRTATTPTNRVITARFAGICGDCQDSIAVGDSINFGGSGRVSHAGCKPITVAPARIRRSFSIEGFNRDMVAHGFQRGLERCEDAPCCACC